MDYEELWVGGPKLKQSPEVFPMGTDAVLLAHFADGRGARKICDLGCGTGLIGLSLAWRNPEATVTAVDIQPSAAELTRENMEINGLSQRASVILGDIREFKSLLPAGAYDLTVSNPPYFAVMSGYSAAGGMDTAREEKTCSISDLCAAAAYITRWGGKFCLVQRPERMAAVISAMCENGLEPKRLRLVQHKAAGAPILFLIEGRRGGKPGLKVEPPLILVSDDGSDTAEIKEIYHRS